MEDYELSGDDLEKRVLELLQGIGINVAPGRPSKEDLVLTAPRYWTPDVPVVVEAKSASKKYSPSIENLRQLDDWVFELSGEQKIRSRSMTQWQNALFRRTTIGPPGFGQNYLDTAGAIPLSPVHPTPHKGLLLFNGPTTQPFEARPRDWLGVNEVDFATTRSFCVMSLENLVKWVEAVGDVDESRHLFWYELHHVSGVFPDPPDPVRF